MPQATIATVSLLGLVFLLSESIIPARGHPYVTDVSAMCTNDGITASLEFDAPFSGKIYSTEFPMTHECIYYNALETRRILFSIPLQKCGTKTTKNTREVIDLMENRVYVQMDKYAQTAYDRQYSFVCELAPNPYVPAIPIPIRSTNEIRRHPIVPSGFQDLGTPIVPVTESSRKRFGLERIDQLGPWAMPQFTVPFTTPPPFLFPPPKNPEWTQHLGQYRSSLDLQSDHVGSPSQQIPPSPADPFGDSSHIKEGFLPELEKAFDEPDKPHATTTKSPEPTTTTYATESSTVRAVIAPVSSEATSTSTSTLPPSTTLLNTSVPVRMIASQKASGTSSDPHSVYLEIQTGDGPFNTTVKGPIQIGDKIALVVRGKAVSKDPSHFNIFVHSCYASDGVGGTRIDLIDSAGCSAHSQVIGQMERIRKGDDISYYFQMRAFKFPGESDVYFFCSVDLSADYNFPELCPRKARFIRMLRQHPDGITELKLYDNVKVVLSEELKPEPVKGNLPVSTVSTDVPQPRDSDNHDLAVIVSVAVTVGLVGSVAIGFVIWRNLQQIRQLAKY